MPEVKHFALPDAGEGLTEAEIISWKVRPGDTVSVNQTIVEIETAKSLVELPCPFAGVVTELLVAEGATVEVGTPIIAVDVAPSAGEGGGPPRPEPARPGVEGGAEPEGEDGREIPPSGGAVEPGLIGGVAPGGRTAVLVGYGPRATSATRRPRAGRGPTPAEVPSQVRGDEPAARTERKPLAKPPVRKLAKDLGVELATLAPSGPGGVVTRADVEQAASGGEIASRFVDDYLPGAGQAGQADGEEGWFRFADSGTGETRIPIRGVRKRTAEAMVASAFTAPHVTEWLSVDVTRSMKLVRRLRADPEFHGVKVSPLLLVARALLLAVRRNPMVNASWDADAQEIVLKHYVNLGIAAATPRGLVVPVIKDAHRLSLRELAEAIAALTATAREGRTQPAEMAGGTITITNVGVFGVDGGTPILNPGEAAILAVGQVRRMPWVHKGAVRPRWATQLSLSFDHRLVDGDLGSRVLADVGRVLERPSTGLVWS